MGKEVVRALALSLLLIAAASSTGSAQPAPSGAPEQPAAAAATATATATAMPMIHPPSQSVQSGSRSRRPRLRRVNLSVNPLGPAIGLYSASLAVAVSRHLALRGDFSTFDLDDDDLHFGDNDPDDFDYTEYGVGLAIYPCCAFKGPFVEPGVSTRRFRHGNTLTGPQLLVGWHWRFASGLNVAAAIGGVFDLDLEGEAENPLNGFFRVGYAL